jgi:predicted nucleic acid-binding protein
MGRAVIHGRALRDKLTLYLDTSTISHLDQQDAPEKMFETRKLWDTIKAGKYEVVISTVTAREINDCGAEKRGVLLNYLAQIQFTMTEVTDRILELANRIVDFGILTRKSFDDCQHIAAALESGCDIIVSWNFKHLVNVRTMKGVRAITAMEGYKDILLVSPSVLLEGNYDS